MNSLSLRLEEGYSRLLEGTHLTARLVGKPFRGSLDFSPLGLARRRRPVDLLFEVAQGFRGRGPGELSWRLRPNGNLRARVLFGGNAFLGNFRVPGDTFAIQWDVEGRVESETETPELPLLARVAADSRFHHAWVEIFEGELSLAQALRASWANFRNPLQAEDVLQLTERQVIRTSWSGRAEFELAAQWGLEQGWTVPLDALPGALRADARLQAGWGVDFTLAATGRFHLQLSRRRGALRVGLRRRRLQTRRLSARAGFFWTHSLRVRRLGPQLPDAASFVARPLAAPLQRQVNRRVRDALGRKLEIAVAAEISRSRGQEAVMQASWAAPDRTGFPAEYSRLLRGRLLEPRQGLRVSGSLSRLRTRRVQIGFHFLDWLRLSRSRTRQSSTKVSISPQGDLLFEETESVERTRQNWGAVQFVRLLVQTLSSGASSERFFTWSWGKQGRFTHAELKRYLRIGLKLRILGSYELPPFEAFPLRLNLVYTTRFEMEGLNAVRRSSPADRWEALIESLELADPQGYRHGSYRRDWIESSKVRESIERNPAQAHLQSQYPVPGRSAFERRQVVHQYRQSRRFLDWLEQWARGKSEVLKAVRPGLGIPVFVFFHRLTPPARRRSALVLTGGLERVWGDPGSVGRKESAEA